MTDRGWQSFLVTGGAGFIGSHLAERLAAAGARVTLLDNLATGSRDNVPPGTQLVVGDVTEPTEVAAAFEEAQPTHVLHLAAQVSNIVSHEDPLADMQTNVGGTINVIAEMESRGIDRLLYASSMALYGSPGPDPVSERARLDPLSPYAISKLAAEQLVHSAARRRTSPIERVGSLRMFNVFGPRQSLSNPYQGVVSVFIANALAGEEIKLYGDGEQSRDFVYIDDAVEAWLAAIDTDTPELRVNVGTGTATTINTLLDSVLAAAGHRRDSYPIAQLPELPGDQRTIRADVSLAGRTLGWRPQTPLARGLEATAEWARGG